ncbi:MAG: Severe Depolymerization of Actin [Piccolia ochrophora]|nr:MAG: Severe Depolymerization of Actin [Piccolia ochrophora]
MGKRKLGALEKIDADLASLQYKIRRDPPSYRDDFVKQLEQYEAQREIFLAAPTAAGTDAGGVASFRDLVDFMAHVVHCYPDLTKDFPEDLMRILTAHHAQLDSELREKLVTSLSLLRKKDVISSSALLHTFFPILTTTPSKALRALLFQKILSDLRAANASHADPRLNQVTQTVLFNLIIADRSSPKGIWAVKLTRELWKRQVWTGARAVEIMKEASLADNEKVIVGGVRFFLGGDQEREQLEEESSDDEDVDLGRLKHQARTNKKTKKKAEELKKAMATVKKKERKRKQPHPLNFSAFHLLHDPQGFAEDLFSKHLQSSRSKINLEHKLQVLQLVTRLVGLHKLTLDSLYSYFLKYVTPKQPSVTTFLACLAQATHNQVPPDALEPLVLKIANEFVSEAAASEVASAGLNAIREICSRQPLAMNETLLQDLVMYRKSKDKGVMMAAKGLLGLYRDVGAEMLKKRERGRDAALRLRSGERKERRFGEEEAGGIQGIELLERWKEEERRQKVEDGEVPGSKEDDDDWDAWDVQEDNSDSSGGWINVDSDNDIEISDSDNDAANSTVKKVRFEEPTQALADGQISEKVEENVDANELSSLATTKGRDPLYKAECSFHILTPADLAKLKELRLQAGIDKLLNPHKKHSNTTTAQHPDDPLTAASIEGLASLSARATKESKLAAAAAGKPERAEHRSKQSRRAETKREQGKSTTNREKARRKNMLMTLGKAKGKQKMSLRDRGKVLKAHVERGKRGGRRGNQ